jgi:hypothetical protein
MNKKKIILSLSSLVIVFSLAGYSTAEKESKTKPKVAQIDTNEVQYELIMNAFFFENKIFKPNAALLLSDKKEIKADAKLFLAPRRYLHLCGFHYRILFWTNSDRLLEDRYLNEKCEKLGYKPQEAQKKLTYYIQQLETAPTHYIYNLEIPVSMNPSEVREKLKDTELNLFFIDGESTRFPSIIFSYRSSLFVGKKAQKKQIPKMFWEKSKEAFNELVEKVESISSVVKSDINYQVSGSKLDSIYQKGYVNLKFEVGTDLSNVITLLEQEGAKIEKQNNPSTYRVQVVDTAANIEDIKNKLKQYEFIKEITEYEKENARK